MKQKLLIGTDEAGYGPNLGPLVITATVWEIPGDVDSEDLWNLLDEVLTDQPRAHDHRLFVADSKQVYSPNTGLVDLETGVLSFLSACFPELCGGLPANARQLGRLLAGAKFEAALDDEPHCTADDCPLPVAGLLDEILDFQLQLTRQQQQSGIRLKSIRSRILFPREFNELVELTGTKGAVLSNCTLELVGDVCPLETLDDETWSSIQIFCDKHGGRNRYDELIGAAFGDRFVFRIEESTARSRYRMGRAEFCFRTKAEQLLPVALASMVSKYLREILMIPFNNFWKSHLPDLKPTKGYPVDARRFRSDIEQTARLLGISEDRFWRIR